MGIAARIALVIGALALSGCWVSETPLITSEEADKPDIEGTWSNSGNFQYSFAWDSTDRDFNTDSGYPASDSVKVQFTFDHIFGDWYLVQKRDEKGEIAAGKGGYEILRVEKQTITRFSPSCDNEVASWPGVSVKGDDCQFSSYDALKKAAVREVKKLGEETPLKANIYHRQ